MRRTDPTAEELRAELERLAPFHHRVPLPHGLSTYLPERSRRPLEFTRVENLVRHAFPALLDECGGSLAGLRVLDVACNCGGFSVEAARLGAERVLGIDVVDRYVEQANLIRRALDLDRVEFRRMAIEEVDESTVGRFDVTFCFGALYHLENPVAGMRRLAAVTDRVMLVDTQVMRKPPLLAGKRFRKQALWRMVTPSMLGEDARAASTTLWRDRPDLIEFVPNRRAVVTLLKRLGFDRVRRLKPVARGLEKRYVAGGRATFLAVRKTER